MILVFHSACLFAISYALLSGVVTEIYINKTRTAAL